MLSQQIRNSGSLLDSVDAVRNWRAALLLLATLVVTSLVLGLGGLMAQVSVVFFVLFALLAYAVLFYGANAAGMMVMDEARGQPSRPMMAAVLASLATSHRLILLALLMGLLYLAGFLVLAIVLFICKIPFLGPVLYTVVFPVSVVVMGIAMFALPTVVFPLSAPSIWSGAGTMQCLSQLVAIARKRLLMVLILMLAVAFIAGVIGLLIGAILFSGVAVTAGLSAAILGGFGAFGGMGGGMGGMAGMMGGMGGLGGHAAAAMIGGGVLFAIAFTLPGMVYLRGACTVYLRAIDGLDLTAEQAAIDEKIAAARAKARDLQAQAQAAAQQYTATPAPAAPVVVPVPTPLPTPAPAPVAAPVPPAPVPPPPPAPPAPVPPPPAVTVPAPPPGSFSNASAVTMPAPRPAAPPATPTPPAAGVVGASDDMFSLLCPSCHHPVLATDTFCGECGHKLE